MKKNDKILVVGIGNEFRSDDSAGVIAADMLREKGIDNLVVRSSARDGSALLILWEGYDNVILIDAVRSGDVPGTVHVIDLHDPKCEEKYARVSGHSFSVFETVKLAGYLGKLPPRLLLYGIEGSNFTMGGDPSTEVVTGIQKVVELITK